MHILQNMQTLTNIRMILYILCDWFDWI